jgi:hypothetical protein
VHYFLSDDLGAGSEVGLLSFLPVSLSLSFPESLLLSDSDFDPDPARDFLA